MIAAALALATGSALAQERFATKGTVAFSADRFFGFGVSHESVDQEGPGGDFENDSTHFTFGWRGTIHPTPFDVPRFAFDYYVTDGLSIGGSIGYANYGGGDDDDQFNEYSDFILAPRVGYTWMFSRTVGFWLRGGFTYHSRDWEGVADESGLALTVEPTFVFVPVEHFGFTAGLNGDFDVTGGRDSGRAEADVHYRSIGIQLGMVGYL
jgi:hypothetical protein